MSAGYQVTEGYQDDEALGYIIGKIFGWFFDMFESLFGVHISGGVRFLIILAIIGLFIYLISRDPKRTQ